MRVNRVALIITLFFSLSACVTPIFQTVPATQMVVVVKDSVSGETIEGAKVFMQYEIPTKSKDSFQQPAPRGPFVTNRNGKCTVKTDSEKIWVWGLAGFFGMDVYKILVVQAPGFKELHRDTSFLGERSGPETELLMERLDR